MHHMKTLTASLLTIGLLAAGCGGGGGSHHYGEEPPAPPPITPEDSALLIDCTGSYCGALNSSVYAGEGVGLWRYSNNSSETVQVPLYLTNLGDKKLTLIYSNERVDAVPMPSVTLTEEQLQINALQRSRSAGEYDNSNRIPAKIRQFDSAGRLRAASGYARAQTSVMGGAASHVVGDSREWTIVDGYDQIVYRSATLRGQTVAVDGRTINLWVENGEYGESKISAALINTLAQKFAGRGDTVYPMVTGIAGQPWGRHGYDNLISATQPLDIVLVNFDRNARPYGLLGYFWGVNNFLKDRGDPDLQYSNESLSFYMDTETFYLAQDGDEGLNLQLSTLAHEFVHMINFYQRDVSMGALPDGSDYAFDVFLEEMSAMMMEDVIGLKLMPTFNSIRDEQYPNWLWSGDFNCSLTVWDSATPECFSYATNATFGAYLLRQYGIDFYKGLLRNRSSTDSVAVLDDAIRQAGGPGLPTAVQRWGTSIALLPGQGLPAGFGHPQRIDSGYTLPAINGPDYRHLRRIPITVPQQLNGFGHFPVLRAPDMDGVYSEIMPVPARTTLSIVVH